MGIGRNAEFTLHGQRALVEAATTIHVTASGEPGPVHVALVKIDGRRVFAKLDRPVHEGEASEEVLAGQTVNLLVKDDGDQYFQVPPGRRFDLSNLVRRITRRTARSGATPETYGDL